MTPPSALEPKQPPSHKGGKYHQTFTKTITKKHTSGRLWCNCYLLTTSRTASTVLLTGRLLSAGPSLGLRQSNTTLPAGPACHPPSPLLPPQHEDGNTTPLFHQCHTKSRKPEWEVFSSTTFYSKTAVNKKACISYSSSKLC